MKKTSIVIEEEKLEVIITRILNAPRSLVYKACTNPEHKAVWWRCDTLTNISIHMDVRQGGDWKIIQQGQDGKKLTSFGKYLEVIPYKKLVNTFELEGMPGHVITETSIFEDDDGKTKLTIISHFQTLDDLKAMIKAGMESGTNESMNHLEELLKTELIS